MHWNSVVPATRTAPTIQDMLLRGIRTLAKLSSSCRSKVPASRDAEFGHHLGNVMLDGTYPDVEHQADLLIGQALGQEMSNLLLAWRQLAHDLT